MRAGTTNIEIPTVIPTIPHDHDSDPDPVAASRRKITMKNTKGKSRGTPTKILVDTTTTVTTEISVGVDNPPVVKRAIRRESVKYLHQNPQSLQGLVIEDQWITTGSDDPQNV